MPRFSVAGEERIRRAMKRGHRGDDPALPIRRLYSSRAGNRYLSWLGPIDHGGPEEPLWEMEIDPHEFAAGRRGGG